MGLLICVGLEFINQLTVEDDERAATLVAVSNKWVYAPRAVCPVSLTVMFQVLRPLSCERTLQTRGASTEHAVRCCLPSDPLHPSRRHHDDRLRYCAQPRTCRQHVHKEEHALSLRVSKRILLNGVLTICAYQSAQSYIHRHGGKVAPSQYFSSNHR